MAVTAAHALLYTSQPDELRAVLRDVFGWSHIDAGGGWLIFALPPAEVGVHPADQPSHELCLMCDDLETTMADLKTKGIEFESGPENQGFGIVATMVLPGDLKMMLYQPRHPVAAGT